MLLFGRGYGVDLVAVAARYAPPGVAYQFGQNEDHPLRSPHSIAMTLLGRSGLVGLALWLLVLAASFGRLLSTTLAARRAGRRDDELLGVWFLAEGVLIVLVAMFGVVLEAPHAAIPFFVILGAALAWASDQATASRRA
jgi:O-antigen ligase